MSKKQISFGKGNFPVHDSYFLQAKKEGYRARSVYKLQEIQQKFHLITPTTKVIDIGCAPGSFLQFLSTIIEKHIPIIGIDIVPILPFDNPNIIFIQESILETERCKEKVKAALGNNTLFDTIISDVSPKTTGIYDLDQYNSIELNLAIVDFSNIFLKHGGNMLLKVFPGNDFPLLKKSLDKHFHKIKMYKPKACRKNSKEIYLICFDKKPCAF